MPALAALAEEARLPGPVTDGLPGLASFRAAYPGYDDTAALDAIRASVGLASNIEDLEKFLTLLETSYRDRPADTCR